MFSKRKLIAALFLTLVFFLIFVLSFRKSTYALRSSAFDLVKVPLVFTEFLATEVRALVSFHKNYIQNISLRRENEKLKGKLFAYQEAVKENERLKKILGFRDSSSLASIQSDVITARVIGRDFHSFRPYLIIDKGSTAGVEKHAPVLTQEGLVGKVLEASRFASKVILINDPDLAVPVLNLRTREHALVTGTLDGRCKVRFLDMDSDVKVGDRIVTSGLNLTYPAQLLIGSIKVIGTEPSGLAKFAILEPSLKLSSLEEVLVVIARK